MKFNANIYMKAVVYMCHADKTDFSCFIIIKFEIMQ